MPGDLSRRHVRFNLGELAILARSASGAFLFVMRSDSISFLSPMKPVSTSPAGA